MESSLKELAGYRLARAREMLSASESNLEIGRAKMLNMTSSIWRANMGQTPILERL